MKTLGHLPGYAIEGEERAQPTAEKAAPTTAEPPQDTEQRKERETINEQFSILIDSRSRFETGKPGGVWLPMPTTTEQLHAAMESVGITADNPQDFFINGYSSTEDCPFDLPLSVIQSASMDELNYFGKLLEMQSDGDKDKFAAAVTHGEYAGSMKDLINLAQKPADIFPIQDKLVADWDAIPAVQVFHEGSYSTYSIAAPGQGFQGTAIVVPILDNEINCYRFRLCYSG